MQITERKPAKKVQGVEAVESSWQTYHKSPATLSCLLVKGWKPVHATADNNHAVCACIIVGVGMMEDEARSYLYQHDTWRLHIGIEGCACVFAVTSRTSIGSFNSQVYKVLQI